MVNFTRNLHDAHPYKVRGGLMNGQGVSTCYNALPQSILDFLFLFHRWWVGVSCTGTLSPVYTPSTDGCGTQDPTTTVTM